MIEIVTKTRKWGNSVGVLLGKSFKPNTKVRILVSEEKISKAGDVFGTLRLKTPTSKLMKEIDEELGV
ncbi:hypothetical protein J4413_01405 [Candidatus Woesearchaeota archaeon]|nr:hypothetical protein [Candidatus Woesearchaeota archaeon]